MSEERVRRPIRSRDSLWAMAVTRALVRLDVPANAISLASVVFAAAAAVFLVTAGGKDFDAPLLLVLAALMILLRLLCNMFDGMVAVEGGLASKSGALFNELPDRVADVLILLGAGYGLGLDFYGPTLGWAASVLAILTAYVRAFGTSLGMAPDFRGPMAKPHRMQLLIAASLVAAVVPLADADPRYVVAAALALIVVGAVITVIRRTIAIHAWLNEREA